MWVGILAVIAGLYLLLHDRPEVRWLLMAGHRQKIDARLLTEGLNSGFEHRGEGGRWVVHYDGEWAPGVSAGARLDSNALVLNAGITLADGRLDLPLFERCDADPGGDSGAATAILLGTARRRAALRAFFDHPMPGAIRWVRIRQSTLTLEVTLPAASPSDPISDALDALRAAALGVQPGLDRPLASQLADVVDDRALDHPLRESARRRIVIDHPQSDEARRLARALVQHRDPLVALSAAVIVDAPPRIIDTLRQAGGPASLDGPGARRWADVLDRARAILDPDAAAEVAPTIRNTSIRLKWLEALIRGGFDRPARRALVTDPDPSIRVALIRRLADRVGPAAHADPELEQLWIAALDAGGSVAPAAARALAAHGTVGALRPLRRWRASVGRLPDGHPLEALADLVDAGLDRIRSGLDPVLAGQLTIAADGGDGRLSLGDDAVGRLSETPPD